MLPCGLNCRHNGRSAITAQLIPSAAKLLYTLSPAAGHDKPEHPETPARVAALQRALEQCGLDAHPKVSQLLVPELKRPVRRQLEAIMQFVHPPVYLSRLQEICADLRGPTMIDDSTYISPGSYVACCETAASVLDVLDAVLSPHQQQQQQQQQQPHSTMGFCLVRPPGHHVKASRPMGFGLINFMAVAAAAALQHPSVNKVLIIDWDVHHGNGTEDIFYSCGDVMYISTHQQGLWPYTGKVTSTGSGAGRGATINLPLPGDAGHDSMTLVWQQVVEPAARSFRPDLILGSAGFDAHWADPLAGLQLEARTYHMLCQQMALLAAELCQGRCMWIMEGGYHIASLSASVANAFSGAVSGAVLPEAGVPRLRAEPLSKVEFMLQQVKRVHGLLT